MADETKYSATSGAQLISTGGYAQGQELAAVDHARILTSVAWRGSNPIGADCVVHLYVWTQDSARSNGVAEVYKITDASVATEQEVNGISGCVVASNFNIPLNANQRYLIAFQWYYIPLDSYVGLSYVVYRYNSGDFTSDEDAFVEITQAAWDGTGDGWYDKTVFVAAFMETGIITKTKTVTIDGNVVTRNLKQFTLDGIIQSAKELPFTIDAIVKEIKTSEFILDAVVAQRTVNLFTIDGMVKSIEEESISLDGLIAERMLKNITLDALVKEIQAQNITIDGVISTRLTKQFFISTIIKQIVEHTLHLEGNIVDRKDKAFDISGLIRGTFDKGLLFDVLELTGSAEWQEFGGKASIEELEGSAKWQELIGKVNLD